MPIMHDPSDAENIGAFANGEFSIEVIPDGDSFRVPAPGLARALAFRDAYRLVESIPDSEKGYTTARTPGGDQRVWHVTEAGFYRALGQRQPARIKNQEVREQVERFQNWIYREVLPSLRKHGNYSSDASRRWHDQFTQIGVTMRWEDAAFIARTKFAFNVTVGELRSLLQSAGILTLTGRPHTTHERMFEFAPSGTRYEPHAVVVPWLIAEAMRTRRRLVEASHRAQLAIPSGITPQTASGNAS